MRKHEMILTITSMKEGLNVKYKNKTRINCRPTPKTQTVE